MSHTPEQSSLSIAGPWLDMGIDMRLETHQKTRIHMRQAISRIQSAGAPMVMVNFVDNYVNFHYSQADIQHMNDFAIRGFNATWAKYKRVWPTNTESNPWAHLLEEPTAQ